MIVLVGKSASGKTEVAKRLIKYHLKKIITYTTRKMRKGEINDRDYHFVTTKKFQELLKADFFFEHTCYNGKYYGTAKKDLQDDCVIILDPNGLKKLQASNIKHTSFYFNTSDEVRISRMKKRGDSETKIAKRLANDKKAFDEIKVNYDHIVDVTRTDIDDIVKEICLIYFN